MENSETKSIEECPVPNSTAASSYGSSDPDERRRKALAKIDNVDFSWFHFKVCLVAGVGFFTDAYDIFAINIASSMLGYLYGTSLSSTGQKMLSTSHNLTLNVATPVGTLVGQLLFGWLSDIVGRKRIYGVELMIIITATFGQAVSGAGYRVNIISVLAVWRLIMGIGIGGDYPVSAVISSEFASTRIRGRMMTAVFASQGSGYFTSTLVGFILVAGFKDSSLDHVDDMWRVLIGLGCVPGVIALYFRLTIPETPRFTMDIERNVNQALADIESILQDKNDVADPDVPVQRVEVPKATWADFYSYFSKWENMKLLIGTSYSWFVLDITFYGLGLNSNRILKAINFGSKVPQGAAGNYPNLKNLCIGNMIISASGIIPGYWATFCFIDTWGRRPIQLMGFSVLAVLFLIMGFGFDKLHTQDHGASKAFVFLYCLANFFQNFGPNTTTFIYPGELFPTRYRTTAHGISAASGKLGAIIAQLAFVHAQDNNTLKIILEVFAFIMMTGVASTLLLPETKNKTLEELSNEQQEGFVTGWAGRWNGY